MKKILTLLLALLAFVLSARAEDNSAKLALAREAISAMQADKMFDSLAAQMKQMVGQTTPMPANLTPAQKELYTTFMGKVMDLSMNEAKGMISKMDVVYADIYTEQELKAMVAFFKSPEGTSMMAKQPQAMARIMPLVQEMQQRLMPEMQKLGEQFQADLKAAK